MKTYTYPTIELTRISTADVITASVGLKVESTYVEESPISIEDGFTLI